MWKCASPTLLVEEAPEIEFRGGLFYLTVKAGDETIALACRPSVFFQGLAAAATAARGCKFGGAEVISLADHAASASGSPSK